jgi:hypothetical protein
VNTTTVVFFLVLLFLFTFCDIIQEGAKKWTNFHVGFADVLFCAWSIPAIFYLLSLRKCAVTVHNNALQCQYEDKTKANAVVEYSIAIF